MPESKVTKHPMWQERCKPVEDVKPVYRCPHCDYKSTTTVSVRSHIWHKHLKAEEKAREKEINDMDKASLKKLKEKVLKPVTCCDNPHYRLLNNSPKELFLRENMGFKTVCKNCDELRMEG